MDSGVQVDMITGRPVEMQNPAREAESAERKKRRLKEQTEILTALQTEPGRAIARHIMELLDLRIAELTAADPEAKAYQAILEGFYAKVEAGKRAIEKYETMINRTGG